jgi:arsenate reductase-like glutaredoxin family protein
VNARRRALLGLAALVLGVGAAQRWWAGRSQRNSARRWLQQHGVPLSKCVIETDPACAAAFEAVRTAGTPVVVVRGRPQLGFDAQRVLDALPRG